MISVALLLHLWAVIFWVGGMAFAHMVLRPALSETLEAPQRLLLLQSVLRRFLPGVTMAIVLILVSGGYLMTAMGPGGLRPAIHAMTALGLVMTVVFGVIRLRSYPALRAAVEQGTWPAAATAAATIRHLVAVNLVLGLLTIAVAVLWR